MNIPATLRYSKSDEWVKVEGNVATIGITDYAQNQLSDIVFVEITFAVGDQVKKNTVAATLESVKAAADINSPLSGQVLDINVKVSQSPELVNSDPFGEAWMFKVQIDTPSELDALMDANSYEKFCTERNH
jgi:glycine cleavage system H protein